MNYIAVVLKNSIVKEPDLVKKRLQILNLNRTNDLIIFEKSKKDLLGNLEHLRTKVVHGHIEISSLKDFDKKKVINKYKVKNSRDFPKFGEIEFSKEMLNKLQICL